MDNYERLKKLVEVANEDRPSTKEVAKMIKTIIDAINRTKESLSSELELSNKQNRSTVERALKSFTEAGDRLEKMVNKNMTKSTSDMNILQKSLEKEIGKVKDMIEEPDFEPLWQKLGELEGKIPDAQEEINSIQIRNKLESLSDDERLDKSAIRGLDELEKRIRQANPRGISLIGGGRGIQLYVDSEKKGLVQFLDIVPGPGMTITDSVVNGLHTLTFSSSGGSGGITTLAATETPNGNLTTFTFADASAQPSFLVVDNVWMKATTATGSTNWTWDSGAKQATLSIPASDDIWALI